MNLSDKPSRSSKGMMGPRPTPLKLQKDSHKIKKKSLGPSHDQQHQHQHQHQYQHQHKPPVIIYTVSPKVIHTNPSEFMKLVQSLTGSSSSSSSSSYDYDNMEKAKTQQGKNEKQESGDENMFGKGQDQASLLEPNQSNNLYFSTSPSLDHHHNPNSLTSFFQDLSPKHGNKTYTIEGSFLNSPTFCSPSYCFPNAIYGPFQ